MIMIMCVYIYVCIYIYIYIYIYICNYNYYVIIYNSYIFYNIFLQVFMEHMRCNQKRSQN